MAAPASIDQSWRFGVFEVDTRRVELRRSGRPVKIREQSFLILVYLLEHADEIVTREELRRVLWPTDTFVDYDHSLSTAMMNLRDALGDSVDTPRYIETVPKRGYRFIADVSQAGELRNGLTNSNGDRSALHFNGENGASQIADAPSEDPKRDRRLKFAVALGGLGIIALIGFIVLLRSGHLPSLWHIGKQASSNFQLVPITTKPGRALFPALSPDGREIAFVWDGPERNHFDVYMQLVGAETPLRLTHIKSGLPGAPAWSPDGREIAFTRCDGKNDGVFVVPALGGEERELTNNECKEFTPSPLAWVADGKGLLMIDRCAATGLYGVVFFSLAAGEKQCLTHFDSANTSNNVYNFSLSPDGSTIAFAASAAAPCLGDIFTIPVSGGLAHQLTAEGHCYTDMMWSPDNKSIVFTSTRSTLPSLWRVSASGGAIEVESTYPAVGKFSKDGERFVYEEPTSTEGPEIWRAELSAVGGQIQENKMIVHTQYSESDAQPSPDGRQIVWRSHRTGFAEIFRSDATGENPLQLTHLNQFSGSARWSPDGKWIAFDSFNKDGVQIYVVDAEGRNLHAITDGPDKKAVPSWSRDGKQIYFGSMHTGSWQVWRHTLEDGAELQLTTHGGFDPFESEDGRTVYFSKFDQAGIWSIPASGGTETLVVADKPQVGFWGHWAVTKTGLYLLNNDAESRPQIEFYEFATRQTKPVLTFEKRPLRQYPSLSATADGRTIYYTQYDRQSVIKMMEMTH